MGHRASLEVVVGQLADAEGAQEGGADRLALLPRDGRSPEPALVSELCRETDLPVRVLLRLGDPPLTTAAELDRLAGLGRSYLSVGADGLVFGFLNRDLEVDAEACARLADDLGGARWTFDRSAFDAALDPARAWRTAADLPALDGVTSAGSARGSGHAELTDRAASSPGVAVLLWAGGALTAEHVPWLVRAGVRGFQVADQVRPGGSGKAYVDPRLVRSWRMLLDHATSLAGPDRRAGAR